MKAPRDVPNNLWAVLFTKLGSPINNNITIPIKPGTTISFDVTGVLDNPLENGLGGTNCLVPPCYDNISVQVEDTHGNIIAYVLDRYPSAVPNNTRNNYREILLNYSTGTYSRNLYNDFSTIPGFSPNNSDIYSIQVYIDEHGWCVVDNIVLSTAGILLPPAGVSATDWIYTDHISVTWNSVPGADAYEVWRNTSNDYSSATNLGSQTSPYEDYSATAATTYYYWIKAKNASSTSAFGSPDTGYAGSISPSGTFGHFGGLANIKIVRKDCDGNDVTFMLSGGGFGVIDPCDCGFGQATLYETTAVSVLTISGRAGTGSRVGDITCSGPLKSLIAKNVDLHGNLTIGSSSNPKAAVAITFDEANDLNINSQMPIKSITATQWLGGSVNAPSLGSITTKGDKKRGIAGNLDIDVTVPGVINSVKVAGELAGTWDCHIVNSIAVTSTDDFDLTLSHTPDLKIPALGKLTVKEEFGWSQILSSGNIGTITVGEIIDSSCFAGVTTTSDTEGNGGPDDVLDLPDPNTDIDYVYPATIKSIAVKGVKGWGQVCFIGNSNFAAATILSISLTYPQNDNGGVPFGVAAGYIKKLTIKDVVEGTIKFPPLDNPGDSRTLPPDFEIRLH